MKNLHTTYSYITEYHGSFGSITHIAYSSGELKQELSYDSWERLRNPDTYEVYVQDEEPEQFLNRGYASHEHLQQFGLININQRSLSQSRESNTRLYDPVLGRFLCPDPYVQMPDNSQSFNRYSYCLNNPLKYTDPSGENFIIAFALFNMAKSMIMAAYNGKNVWVAGGLSLLSSAATYGIGELFGATGNLGHELLRAGAHGLADGAVAALGGGNFGNAFISGATSSALGSFAKGVKMNNNLMITTTTLTGGFAAWATGGDFLLGAMQGMRIGALNHAIHDNEITYYKDEQGCLCGNVKEVVVEAPRYNALFFASGLNTTLHIIGTSLKDNGGNSTFGSNYKFYWHSAGQSGFYGNQHVKTVKLTTIGKRITKVTGPVGKLIDGYKVLDAVATDLNDYQNGYTDGYNTVRATADIAGGWAGAIAGLKAGAFIGAGIASAPGAVVGGIIGGIAGAFGGSSAGVLAVDKVYGK